MSTKKDRVKSKSSKCQKITFYLKQNLSEKSQLSMSALTQVMFNVIHEVPMSCFMVLVGIMN